MQNRYAGDIGDFGKLGLLRELSQCGMTIGVNWYLTPDENHNKDGRYVDYLTNDDYRAYDETLWHALGNIVGTNQRTVTALEKAELLPVAFTRYYHDELNFSGMSKKERQSAREKWHASALDALRDCDIIFVDPDNGLIVPSAKDKKKSNKFVLPCELRDYYQRGASVIYYQHKARRPDLFYMEQHNQLLSSDAFCGAAGLALKFVRTSHRYYFFILQPQHKDIISSCIGRMLATPWHNHFENKTDMLT